MRRAARGACRSAAIAVATAALALQGCSDCAYRDLAIAGIAAYFDPSLSNVARVEVVGSSPGAPTLAVDDYPGLEGSLAPGQSGSVSLADAANGDPQACGLCVIGSRGADVFTPLRGSAAVLAPARTGDAFSVTFSGLALQRIDPDTYAPADDGHAWCLRGGTTLSAATTAWPCSAIGTLLPGASLTEGGSVCIAAPAVATYVLWTCRAGVVVRGSDCAAAGATCDPAANVTGSAACQ